MKDREDLDDLVLVDEVDREREPPRQNSASVHEDGRIGQRSFRSSLYCGVELEEELDP